MRIGGSELPHSNGSGRTGRLIGAYTECGICVIAETCADLQVLLYGVSIPSDVFTLITGLAVSMHTIIPQADCD